MSNENRAFIIGNGESRKDFDLSLLNDQVTFGCNALYRVYCPTYIVSIDPMMVKEVQTTWKYANMSLIIPSAEEQYEPAEYNPARPRSNAGMNCMIEAVKRDFTNLYCIGMDFLLADPEGSTSNMFDGTQNYGPETRTSLNDSRARMGYFGWYLEKNPNIDFTFIFNKDDKVYKPQIDNFNLIHYDELSNILKD